ncbi:MAG: trigger factor [Cytophagales bacterium]
MEITLNKKESNHGHIEIKFDEKDYKEKIEQKLKEYGKTASLKGFRPGKVPPGLINKMYGKSIKIDEINKMVSESVESYIKEKDLKLIGDPLPAKDSLEGIDWAEQKDFEFKYEVGLVPNFEIPLSEKTKFAKYEIKPDQKTLDKTILNIRKQSAERNEMKEVADDSVLTGKLENKEAELEKQSEIDLSLISSAKEKKSLIGKKVGDTVEINLVKAFDKEPDELSRITGKALIETKKMKGKFHFTIEKIETLKLPELNKDLFDRAIGPDKAKDLSEFKTEVEKIIAKNNDRESEGFLQREIQDYLVDKTKMELPKDFLKRWLLVSNDGKVTEEQIEKEFDLYVKELKWNLIISKIQQEQKIEIKHEDILQETRNMVINQFGGGFDPNQMGEFLEQFVQNYLKENKGQNYMNIHRRLLDQKVMEWTRNLISVKDKKVAWEEFEKIVLK